jgi:hypothetical protein
MTIQQLRRRWAITTVLAIVSFAVLAFLDQRLKAVSGFGTFDLQKVSDAGAVSDILAHWYAPSNAVTAGFDLGFDYLFMLLYGLAFFYSGLLVRERLAPKRGLLRRALQFVAAIPVAGALADVVENGLETKMLVTGPTDQIAMLAFTATQAKLICFYIGIVLLIGAILARLTRPKADAAS